jgi:hypothetical protein
MAIALPLYIALAILAATLVSVSLAVHGAWR